MSSIADDVLVEHMRKYNMPITRENYIRLNWGNTPPPKWTLEHELELPDELQDTSWVDEEHPGWNTPGSGTPSN